MHITPTPFNNLVVIEPNVFKDNRGYFFESWNRAAFEIAGLPADYVQDNQSASAGNVLRGLHFQVPPHDQGKLVRVLKGSVLDVVVDLRRDEPTYGRHFKLTLTAGNHRMLYVPPGFAHGFLTLEDDTVFFYKCSRHYNKDAERAIRWNDPDLAIDWETEQPMLSDKDQQAMLFREFDSPF